MQSNPNKPDIQCLSPLAVSTLLSVSRRRVYQLIEQGLLPAVRFGPRQLRVRRGELEEFIAAHRVNPEDIYNLREGGN